MLQIILFDMEYIDLIINFTIDYRTNIDSCADTTKISNAFKERYSFEQNPFDTNETYWAVSATIESMSKNDTSTLPNDEIRAITKQLVQYAPDASYRALYHLAIKDKNYNRLTSKKFYYCCQEELAKNNLTRLNELNTYIDDIPPFIKEYVVDKLASCINISNEEQNNTYLASYWFIDCKWKTKTNQLTDLFITDNPIYDKSKYLKEMFTALWRRLFNYIKPYESPQPKIKSFYNSDEDDEEETQRYFDEEFGYQMFNSFCKYLKQVKHIHNKPLSKQLRKHVEPYLIIINPFEIIKLPKRIEQSFKTLYPDIVVKAKIKTDINHWSKIYLYNVSRDLYPWNGKYDHSIKII